MATTSFEALTYKRAGKLRFVKNPIPSNIGPTSVLIKIRCAALNPVDIKLANLAPLSFVPGEKAVGRDYSGDIVKVGDAITNQFQPGDRVCGMLAKIWGTGTLATHIVIDINKQAVIKVPNGLSYEEAAAFPLCFGTAYQALAAADPKLLRGPDSSVLILGGATTVGSFAIQLAKQHFGVDKVVATCSTSSESYVRELGADITVDYRKSKDLAKDIINVVNTDLDGKRFAFVLDCIGGYEVVSQFPKLLLPSRTGSAFISIVGDVSSSDYTASHILSYLYRLPFMATRIFFGRLYGINYHIRFVSPTHEWVKKAKDIFEQNHIKVTIDSVYPLKDWKQGWTKLDSQRSRGKVVIAIE
ncbi:Ast1p [Sugiyamaella lignohabitans]|uniref:Ast1p n=1 Tax=Sugiyamaella lignohabitans TaxID=796027 RepID=A0A167DAR0_9ASCO|nr:Ast1p [Sugiyamaella lignohabitans]ANB12686.1 Ast1p [Sugiyamaella lignohabitans]